VSVRIYVEGGGDNEDTITRCRQGFADYCAKAAPGRPRPRIVPCGGRNQTFDRFKASAQTSKSGDLFVLLVDAEGRVTGSTPIEHLRARDGWDFTGLLKHRVFLMVQAMEAWFLADRGALTAFYGDQFLANSLPGSPNNIEAVAKNDLEPKLIHATKSTKTKGEYHKTKHGFALLALIDPKKVEDASPHAASFNKFLRELELHPIQQLIITAEQPLRTGFHCTRNCVTAEDSMRRMASNSPLFWL
jgi:hypothetical protein